MPLSIVMPKPKRNRFPFLDSIYCYQYYISFGETCEDACAWVNKQEKNTGTNLLTAPPFNKHRRGHTIINTNTCVTLIWFRDLRPRIATIAHEAEHAVFYCLRSIGMKHKDSSDEAYAYLLGWLVGGIEYAMKRKKKEK